MSKVAGWRFMEPSRAPASQTAGPLPQAQSRPERRVVRAPPRCQRARSTSLSPSRSRFSEEVIGFAGSLQSGVVAAAVVRRGIEDFSFRKHVGGFGCWFVQFTTGLDGSPIAL